jgi:hypothetical protein
MGLGGLGAPRRTRQGQAYEQKLCRRCSRPRLQPAAPHLGAAQHVPQRHAAASRARQQPPPRARPGQRHHRRAVAGCSAGVTHRRVAILAAGGRLRRRRAVGRGAGAQDLPDAAGLKVPDHDVALLGAG